MQVHISRETEKKIRHVGYLAAAPVAEMWLTFLEIVRETLGAIRDIPSVTKEMFRAR